MGPGVSTSVTHEPEYNTSVNASEETPSTPQSHPHSPISVVIDVNEPPDTPKPEILPVIPPVNPFVQDPKLGLDEKSKFWEEYSQYAWKYDTDLVKGLREDLQGLLTFAGLFSAVNTAVIIESIKDLKADSAATTNDLVRDLIRSVRDPSNHTYEDTQMPTTFEVTVPALRANMFFFASLCCSLCTAFGAVLSKQWLDTYENDGPPKPLPEKCRERHLKFMGSDKWHLEGIIQTLPSLLQLSLFLFLIGLTDWVWQLNKTVAAVICAFAIITFLFFAGTTTISVFDPSSPFQNRFTIHLRGLLNALRRMVRKFGTRVTYGVKRHKWHTVWSWPFILISAVTSTKEHMRETPPVQLVKELIGLRTGFFAPRTKVERLLKAGVSLLRSGNLSWRRIIPLLHLTGTSLVSRVLKKSARKADSTSSLVDVRGSECVLWLVKEQLATNTISAGVVEAATTLDYRVFERSQVLKLVILAILNPRKQANTGSSRWFLDIPEHRLRSFLPFLGHLISQSSDLSQVILEDESGVNCDLDLWSLLCQQVWLMVANTPNDEQLVTSACVVLNSERIVQCSIRPSSLKSLMYLKEQLDPHVRKLIDHPFKIELAPHILNCLAVLSSACAVHVEQPQNANSDAYDGILDESLLLSLIKSIKVEPGSYGHRWRGKLLLLWLESQPVHTIPHLEHVAVELSMLMQNWRWSDQLYWKNPHQELVLCRRSLYLDTLQLLLVNNHALWSQVLKSSCDYLQDLLLVQTPWQRSTHEIYELHNDGQSLRTKRTQIIWGHMLPPLVHVMAIWSKLRRWDPEVAEQYHTWKWSRAVRNSVKSLAKLRSISINHFCDNITPTEIMEMMESVADYTRSCNRRPRHPSKFLNSFRDLARLLLQDYDPTKLRFSNRQRAEQAQEFWENTSCRQFWKEHIRRVSEGLKIADMPVGEEPVDWNSHPLSEALG